MSLIRYGAKAFAPTAGSRPGGIEREPAGRWGGDYGQVSKALVSWIGAAAVPSGLK